jgi:hypothetical protein
MTLRMYLTTRSRTWGLYSSFEPNINGVQAEAAALTPLLRATEAPAPPPAADGRRGAGDALDGVLEDLQRVTTLTSLFGDPVYVLDVPDRFPGPMRWTRAR